MSAVTTLDEISQKKDWPNAVAEKNICSQLVKLLTSQDPTSWLKAVAKRNILCMFATFLVSHPPMYWLNAVADRNI